MVIDDNLVKLASFGAAGISVLAVFIIGFLLWKLPANPSKEKVGLLKFYTKWCVVFVIICGLTGIANAAFNKEKIDEKQEEVTQVTRQYDSERTKWISYKQSVTTSLNELNTQLNSPNLNRSLVQSNINSLRTQTSGIEFSPLTRQRKTP